MIILLFISTKVDERGNSFFFQAEDGIRDRNVTGVQTCALPISALVIRWNYWEAFNRFDPAKGTKSQLVFSTLPGNNVLPISQLGAFRDQIIGTAMLVMVIFAIIDTRNLAPSSNMGPLLIGLLVVVIGMTLGAEAAWTERT